MFEKPLVTRRIAVLLSTSIVGTQVFAAPALQAPNAGQIERQVERSLPSAPLPKVLPPIEDDKKPSPEKQPSPRIELKGVRFEGNLSITSEQLKTVIDDSLGKQLTINELKGLADLVVREYSRFGFLAAATLPPQDVVGGVITIKIQEARFSGAFVDKASLEHARVEPGIVESVFASSQPIGDTVNFDQIERAEILISDMGYIVSGGFQPGKQEGETAYGVVLNQQAPFSGVMSIDNQGSRSTGDKRALVNVDWLSPLRRGDTLSLSLLKTEGTEYARLGYKMPVGFEGWTLETQLSALNYEIVTADFASTRPKGETQMASLGVQYPLLRSRSENLYFASSLSRNFYKNEQISSGSYAVQSDYHVDAMKFGLTGNRFIQNRVDQYGLDLTLGKANLSGSQNYSDDQTGAKTHGRFAKLGINLSTKIPVSTWNISSTIDAQVASKNLDSSQKFYLGGASGVRAYPESEGAGVNGFRFSLEADRQLTFELTGSVFYDFGRIQQYDNNENSSGSALADVNVYNLSGYGVSLNLKGPRNSLMKAIWSRRIGSNPNPTSTGLDQDGSLEKDRFWLSIALPL